MAARVLVVDDDDDVREALCDALEAEGYSAIGVSGGKEALQYLNSAQIKPSLVLLDFMMPEMNGWQFREAQRSTPALCEIPVVGITAQRMEHAPIDTPIVLRKPFQLEELLEVVSGFCKKQPA